MTILQINKFFYRRGGADHHYLDLIDLLKDNNQKVVTFSMRDKNNFPSLYEKYFVSHIDFSESNLKKIFSATRLIYSLEAKRNLNSLIKQTNPQVAHLHLIYHHLSPSILVALKKHKIPTVMTIHDWKPLCPAYSLFTKGQPCERCINGQYIQCFKNRCIKNSASASLLGSVEAYIHHAKKYYENYIDLLIAPSNFVKEKFIYFGWPEEKIRVLPHFLPINFAKVDLLPAVPKEKRFAYIGRLSSEKGIDKLVDWWIRKKIPYMLDIYGQGPLKSFLEKKIVSANAHTKIVLHGNLSRINIYAGLDHTTAVIMPSVCWETFGLTAIESFARGIPAIMSARGSFIELAEKSGAGILFDWEKDNLETALNKADDSIYRQQAIEYMKHHHLSDDYFKKLMAIYAEIS